MSDDDDLVKSYIEKHGVRRVSRGVGAHLKPKHWDAITQTPGKVDVKKVAAEKRIKPPKNDYEQDKSVTAETKVKVRDIKTGPKGGGKVKTIIGYNRHSKDTRADVDPKWLSRGSNRHAIPLVTPKPPPEEPLERRPVSPAHVAAHAEVPHARSLPGVPTKPTKFEPGSAGEKETAHIRKHGWWTK